MQKGKGRTFASHQDNYRRGGLRLGNLGQRWLDKKDISAQELLGGIAAPQGGNGMNGINNPLGALTALAGLAQNKNDPMAALSALSAMSGSSNGSANSGGNAAGNASANPADLINILSKLKPQGSNAAQQNNQSDANNQSNPSAGQAFNNSRPQTPPQTNAAYNETSRQQPFSSPQQTQGRSANQTQAGSRRKSNLRQKAQQLYAEEPQSGCENCPRPCPGSFRNYPSWSDINNAAAPWRRKTE